MLLGPGPAPWGCAMASGLFSSDLKNLPRLQGKPESARAKRAWTAAGGSHADYFYGLALALSHSIDRPTSIQITVFAAEPVKRGMATATGSDSLLLHLQRRVGGSQGAN